MAVQVAAACSGGVVTTGDGSVPASSPPPAPPPPSQRPSNANLVNAFDFYGQSSGGPGYFFTTPSGSWRCAIVPHEQAACQSAKSTGALSIKGAPATVTGAADGAEVKPNALVVQTAGDAHFATLDARDLTLAPGPAQTLQFGKILAAAGFRCNVQDLGISCLSESSQRGFTFSADGFAPRYTDLPAGP